MSKKSIILMFIVCMSLCLCACRETETTNTLFEGQIGESTQREPEEKKEKRLSADYRILCGGKNGTDYYEVVYKEVEDYTGLTKYAGLIKNNEWHEELSDTSIFLGRNIVYLGKGCFMLSGNTESVWRDSYMCIYNVENKQKYLAEDNSDFYYEGIDFTNIDAYDEELLIVGICNKKIRLLNKSTMMTHDIELNLKTIDYESISWSSDTILNNVCDGVFSIAEDDSWTRYGRDLTTFRYIFFDVNGNEILNLYEYAATSRSCYFKNGQLRLSIRNSNNTNYAIIIDKEGNVLKSIQEK